jgi:Fungalysin metallopeptidase (M36)/F5/8 type C domain/Fungalysin/Thermolysin Propeptide Motif
MLRRCLIGLLVFALAATATIVFTLRKSGAAYVPQPKGVHTNPVRVQRETLPNYDLRLAGRGEFTDVDLGSTADKRSGDAARQARGSAVDNFRAKLRPEAAENLHAVVNEAGAMKNFFIEGATLSEPQSDAPDNIARRFLKEQAQLFALSDAAVDNLRLEKEDNDRGTTFLEYSQTIGGVKVYEGSVKVVVNKQGEVLSVREGFIVSGQKVKLRPALNETQGIARAFEYAGRTVRPSFAKTHSAASVGEFSRFANPLKPSYEEVLAELNIVRVGDTARLAWHVYAEVGPDEWYELLVDAHTGELLLRHNLYVFEAQGTVYTEHPDAGGRQLVSFVGDTTINTAAGWMGASTVTTGNNVEAYLDTDANNAPDPNNGSGLSNGHAFAPDQNFTFPFSTAVDPRTQQAAVVTNLFYFNNFMHDFSYGLGFTESARNFQVNNYGRGGIGNDSVMAEAQDGSGTNNANFATPPDGQRPRMQQYLFTTATPNRDSSLDGDVVAHEYGHGISNRLIGNASGALTGIQSGAMGEGWSDYWAITTGNDGLVGEYSTNDHVAGIRRAAYTFPANPIHDSYADVGNAGFFEVHYDGEIWAATLWDLRTQLGPPMTDVLVLNGMKFTPNRPSFLNARDGILQADQNLNGGANRCAIWTVFARHGMGVSAVGNDGTTHTAATNVPGDCGRVATQSSILETATYNTVSSQPGVSSYFTAGPAGQTTNIAVNRTGRYVRVQLTEFDYLSLAEVQVMSGSTNLALGRPATQYNTGFGGVATRAVDGNTDGNWANNSVTHTYGDYQNWWQVDLGSVQSINSIQIWNRTDCCSNRLRNFYVFVSDVPFQGSTANKAIDGNTDGFFWNGSVSHTNYEFQPWWQVDLQNSQQINTIQVWNRTDCCVELLSDFYLLVSDVPFQSTDLTTTINQPGVSSYYTAGPAGRPTSFTINRTGRYIRIQRTGTGHLSVAEVQVQ